jgi:hypothetical protein
LLKAILIPYYQEAVSQGQLFLQPLIHRHIAQSQCTGVVFRTTGVRFVFCGENAP